MFIHDPTIKTRVATLLIGAFSMYMLVLLNADANMKNKADIFWILNSVFLMMICLCVLVWFLAKKHRSPSFQIKQSGTVQTIYPCLQGFFIR